MSKQTLNTASGEKLTKQDLQKVYIRNLFGLQWGWNYETMQGLGYCYVIMPILRRLYRNDPEKMKKALKTEIGYFNTSQPMSHLIVGTDAASVLGLTVVGALVPSVVKVPMNVSVNIGEVSLDIQSMLDKIIPAALPLAVVLLSYWLLGKKKMTTVKLILILMVVGVAFGLLNVFFATPA